MTNASTPSATVAFVFPGQGSQSVGMLKDLAQGFPQVRATFEEASQVLGYDLWHLVQTGPDTELNKTYITQPAMLAAGVAVWRVWQARNGVQPAMMAGHSLGEYSALVCAGAMGFADAVSLVADRGRFMQEAVPEGQGAMAAILGLDDSQVVDACDRAAQGEVVAAVNFNSVGQVVIAGDKAAVERAMVVANELGAKRAMLLPVSVPSHCALMLPAAHKLRQRLAQIAVSAPAIDVINNVDVAATRDPEQIKEALVRQLHNPVRWVESVQYMAGHGIKTLVECGPGKVLIGLAKRITKDIGTETVYDPASLDKTLTTTGGA